MSELATDLQRVATPAQQISLSEAQARRRGSRRTTIDAEAKGLIRPSVNVLWRFGNLKELALPPAFLRGLLVSSIALFLD